MKGQQPTGRGRQVKIETREYYVSFGEIRLPFITRCSTCCVAPFSHSFPVQHVLDLSAQICRPSTVVCGILLVCVCVCLGVFALAFFFCTNDAFIKLHNHEQLPFMAYNDSKVTPNFYHITTPLQCVSRKPMLISLCRSRKEWAERGVCTCHIQIEHCFYPCLIPRCQFTADVCVCLSTYFFCIASGTKFFTILNLASRVTPLRIWFPAWTLGAEVV